jgi:hypothetical protein
MSDAFEIRLEYVGAGERCQIFRLAFQGSAERLLLPYPKVTGLKFAKLNGETAAEWGCRFLVSAPQDDFVLTPEARIAFDLRVYVDIEPTPSYPWIVRLPSGTLTAQYVLDVNADRPWYDFLAKRSRFVGITKQWGGSIKSNLVEFTVAGIQP